MFCPPPHCDLEVSRQGGFDGLEICVGIVIPIYNAAPYLRECLDSVLNQSHENLSIVLVDDKSTDGSLEIAREYAARDSRISLIALSENSGQSVARNIGMEFLRGGDISTRYQEMRLKIAGQIRGINPQAMEANQASSCVNAQMEQEGNKEGGNKEIGQATREATQNLARLEVRGEARAVRYIHFLDSDDWLERDCIERCVELARENGAQVVFHWRKNYLQLEGCFENDGGLRDRIGLDDGLYSGLEILRSAQRFSLHFAWACFGMIDFEHLGALGLEFEVGIENEDTPFGLQLFALSHRVVVCGEAFYNYRLRPNSTCQYTLGDDMDKTQSLDCFPANQRDVAQAFEGNIYNTKHYMFGYSSAMIVASLDVFLKRHGGKLSEEMQECLQKFIGYYVIWAFGACNFPKDPRGCLGLCEQIYSYSLGLETQRKVIYYVRRIETLNRPLLFKVMRKIIYRFPKTYIFIMELKRSFKK